MIRHGHCRTGKAWVRKFWTGEARTAMSAQSGKVRSGRAWIGNARKGKVRTTRTETFHRYSVVWRLRIYLNKQKNLADLANFEPTERQTDGPAYRDTMTHLMRCNGVASSSTVGLCLHKK